MKGRSIERVLIPILGYTHLNYKEESLFFSKRRNWTDAYFLLNINSHFKYDKTGEIYGGLLL